MNIIYLHGFGSIANQNHPKVKELERLGTVKSIAPDYSKSFNEIILHVYSHCEIEQVNLIVGTSMGGWLASIISALDNIPFVAINPSLTVVILRLFLKTTSGCFRCSSEAIRVLFFLMRVMRCSIQKKLRTLPEIILT